MYIKIEAGLDVTDALGIQKWEPAPEKIPVNAKGSFPSHTPKTDEERIQNFMRSLENHLTQYPDDTFEVTEKMEGSSVTIFIKTDEFGICSRNLQLKIDDPDVFQNSHFTKPAYALGLEEKMRALGRNISVQCEVVGPGIQDNIYDLNDWEYFNFKVWDINESRYLLPIERVALMKQLGIQCAPIIETNLKLNGITADDLLKYATGKSLIGKTGTLREGVVFKSNTIHDFTFKAVSQEYLVATGKG